MNENLKKSKEKKSEKKKKKALTLENTKKEEAVDISFRQRNSLPADGRHTFSFGSFDKRFSLRDEKDLKKIWAERGMKKDKYKHSRSLSGNQKIKPSLNIILTEEEKMQYKLEMIRKYEMEKIEIEERLRAKMEKIKEYIKTLRVSKTNEVIVRPRSLSFPLKNQKDREYYLDRAREASAYKLSDDITEKIFGFLQLEDLCKAAQVCKTWNKISKKSSIWNDLFLFYENKLKTPDEKNIWEDPTIENQEREPSKLTLNQLVVRLTNNQETYEFMDLRAFLATYKTFTTPERLVRKLIQRYHVPYQDRNGEYVHKVVRPIQLRVCKVLKTLIDEYFVDLNDNVIKLLKVFVRGFLDQSTTLSLSLTNCFKKRLSAPEDLSTYNMRKEENGIIDIDKSGIWTVIVDDRYNTLEIAQQLTLIEFEFFKNISPEDFICFLGSNSQKMETNLSIMINHFNDVSRWVADTILRTQKCRSRAKKMEKFIYVAEHLKKLQNFETCMAIISTLNETPINRLNFTKAKMKKSAIKIWEELNELLSAENSYSRYRKKLENIDPPCIPYLGIYLRDLIYWNEPSMDNGQTNSEKIINFTKKKYIFNIISTVQRYQNEIFEFEAENTDLNTTLRSLPKPPNGMDHDTYKTEILFNLSYKREPKGAKDSDIL